MSDEVAGWVLLIFSLISVFTCIVLFGKLCQSMLQGFGARVLMDMLNLEFKAVPVLGDLILMYFGAGFAMLLQSSTLLTCMLTPMVGIGFIKVEKMFCLTVGANLGSALVGLLTAMVSSNMKVGMTVALADVFFNIFGAVLWLVLPYMRRVPVAIAKQLGYFAADMRSFPLWYIAIYFALLPGVLMLLCSQTGMWVQVNIGILLLWIFFLFPWALFAAAKWKARRQVVPWWYRWGAQETSAIASSAMYSFDDAVKPPWGMGPVAWGIAWLVIVSLFLALPNAQWASIKHPNFDIREHVGIGTFSVCSAQYKSDMLWAVTPTAVCTPNIMKACAAATMPECTSTTHADYNNFADLDEANKKYEAFWNLCRDKCSTAQWVNYCSSMGCQGSRHAEQCWNVTVVEKGLSLATVTYKSTSNLLAWSNSTDGSTCRPVSEICDNNVMLLLVGIFAWVGAGSVVLGQVFLLIHCTRTDKVWACSCALFFFVTSWIYMLVSWAIFAGTLGSQVTCTMVDSVAKGCGPAATPLSLCAVTAEGEFGDLVDPSYTFGAVVGSWIFLSILIVILGLHLRDLKKPVEVEVSQI